MSDVEKEQSLVDHLIELRSRLVKIMLGVGLCLLALLPFAQKIYTIVAKPLMDNLPSGTSMIATDVIAPFFVPIKVTLMLAFLISLPFSLYQMWMFVAPALYKHEKKLILPVVFSSVVLFVLGMAFAYFLVFPVVFHFMASVTPEGVNMATDIDKYLSFILGMFVAFGVAFEVPIVVVILNRFGIVTIEKLKAARAYVIVGSFIIAAIITPPDVLSQFMLAIPLLILYEAGIFMCYFFTKQTISQDSESVHHE